MARREVRGGRRRRSFLLSLVLGSLLTLATGGLALHSAPGLALRTSLMEQLRSERFQLRRVEFLGLSKLSAAALFERSGLESGVALIDLDVGALMERVCSHPRISDCSAARIPPDVLVIGIEERVPVARLAGSEDAVDLDGARFPVLAAEIEKLPELAGQPQWALGLLAAADTRGLRLARVEAESVTRVRFQPEGQQIRVLVSHDPDRSLDDWLTLRDSGLLGGYAAREVDLRFEGNAVLRDFRKPQGGENGAK